MVDSQIEAGNDLFFPSKPLLKDFNSTSGVRCFLSHFKVILYPKNNADRTAAGKDCVSCRSSIQKLKTSNAVCIVQGANDKRSEVKLKAKRYISYEKLFIFKLFIITFDFVIKKQKIEYNQIINNKYKY